MTIKSVSLQASDMQETETGVRTYTTTYAVAHGEGTTLLQATEASGIPGRGERDPSDTTAYITSRTARRSISDTGKLGTIVTIQSSTRPGFTPEDAVENPLERPAKISLSSQKERRPVQEDNKGNPLTTTAGELLTNIEKDFTLWKLSVSKNIPAQWPRWIAKGYATAVNSDAIRIEGATFPRLTLQVESLNIGETQYENGEQFKNLQLALTFRSIGWEEKYLNFGKYELDIEYDSNAGKEYEVYRPIIIGGKPTEVPVPLDADGRAFREIDINAGIAVVKTQVELEDITENLLEFDLTDVKPFSVFRNILK